MQVQFSNIFVTQAPPPLPTSIKNTPQALALKTEATRRITQGNHENEYQQALGTIREKIKETEGPDIKETMMDQIRQWFIECRQVTQLLGRCSISAVRSQICHRCLLSARRSHIYQQYVYLVQISHTSTYTSKIDVQLVQVNHISLHLLVKIFNKCRRVTRLPL